MSEIVVHDGLAKLVEVTLQKGEKFRTAYRVIRSFTPNIALSTEYRDNTLRRLFSFEPLMWQILTCNGTDGRAEITTDSIGYVLNEHISSGNEWLVDRESLVGADYSVNPNLYQVNQKELGLSGARLFYHHLTGEGNALINIDGTLDKINLASGESMIFDPDYLIMIRPGTKLSLVKVEGWKNKIATGKAYLLRVDGPTELYLDRVVGEHTENYGIIRKVLTVFKDYISPV